MARVWYNVTATMQDKDTLKKSRKVFLCDAVTFTDAEATVTACNAQDKDFEQLDITAVKRESYDEVFGNPVEDTVFYKIRWRFKALPGEKSGPAFTTLVEADSTKEAEETFKEQINESLETEIISVTASNVKRLIIK
jgi:hypothetical protein